MNIPNPLVPQGSLQSQSRGKSHIRIAVFTILAIHVVLLAALLIQGCQREDPNRLATPTNDLPPFVDATNPPPFDTSPPPSVVTQEPPRFEPTNPPPPPVTVPPPVTPPPIAAAPSSEYTVVRGDTLSAIAKKHGVSVKAIQQANPGVDPTKLRVGHRLVIPPKPPGSDHTSSTGTPEPGAGTGNGTIYVVKAGDTLTRIAKLHGTTVAKIQAANNLRTTGIQPGQKLRVPGKPATNGLAPATPPPGSTTSAPAIPPTIVPPAVPPPAVP